MLDVATETLLQKRREVRASPALRNRGGARAAFERCERRDPHPPGVPHPRLKPARPPVPPPPPHSPGRTRGTTVPPPPPKAPPPPHTPLSNKDHPPPPAP